MTSGPVVVQVLEGEGAIAKNREVMGATDPAKAAAGHDPQGLRRVDRGQLRPRLRRARNRGERDQVLLQRPGDRRLTARLRSEGYHAGQDVVITGGTSGIGEVAADRARQGGRAHRAHRARSRRAATTTRQDCAQSRTGADTCASSPTCRGISEMKRVGHGDRSGRAEIDVLINNAGALFNTRKVTEDGLEMTFATNHMAYFVVTNLLLPQLQCPARASSPRRRTRTRARELDFDDLQSAKQLQRLLRVRKIQSSATSCSTANWRGASRARASPRTACIRASSRRASATRAAASFRGWSRSPSPSARSRRKTAPRRSLYLATSPEVEGKSGGYYYKNRLATPTKEAQNDADAKRLWEVSAQLSGVGG